MIHSSSCCNKLISELVFTCNNFSSLTSASIFFSEKKTIIYTSRKEKNNIDRYIYWRLTNKYQKGVPKYLSYSWQSEFKPRPY